MTENRKRLKRRVWYRVAVDFVAYSTEALDYLAKEYPHNPSHEAVGCHIDHGSYSIKRRKIKAM